MAKKQHPVEVLEVTEVETKNVTWFKVESGPSVYDVRIDWVGGCANCTCMNEVFRKQVSKDNECRHIKACREFRVTRRN